MTISNIVLATTLVVAAAIIYFYLPSKKLKAWLCSVLWRVAFLSVPAAAGTMDNDKDKKAVVAVVVGRTEMERVFATFDHDGDGYITVTELQESLRRLGMPTTEAEVARMVAELDTNRDGLLDLEEFRELYNSLGGAAAADEEEEPPDISGCVGREIRIQSIGEAESEETDLRKAFNVFDGNGDGLITVEELAMVLAALRLAPGATVSSCRDMIKEVDMNGDGMVSFEEFKQMMRGAKGRKKLF